MRGSRDHVGHRGGSSASGDDFVRAIAKLALGPNATSRVGHQFAHEYKPGLDISVHGALLDLANETAPEIAGLQPQDRIDIRKLSKHDSVTSWLIRAWKELGTRLRDASRGRPGKRGATMIVEAVEPLALRVPNREGALHLVFCRVRTRDGIEGYGECLCLRPAMQQALVATIRDAIAPIYLGQPVDGRLALNLEVRRRFASFGRSGTVLNALAAVDAALWDIAGKSAGRSLAAMLGGARRTTAPVMASLDRYGDARRARARVEQAVACGVAAVKVHEADLAVIEEARRAAGPSMPFVADVNNAHFLTDIRRDHARWRALDLLWLEDPVWPPEDMLDCPPLPGIAIGLGADLGSAEQLALYARAPAVSFIQPDLCMIGGVSEMLKVLEADVVRTDRRPAAAVAPHTPFVGPAALASLHFIAAMAEPAFFATIEADDGLDLYGLGLQRWQPTVAVPDGPGLGLDPEPAFLARYGVR